jgi:transposase
VKVHRKETVSAVSNIVAINHNPNYNLSMQWLQTYKYELMPNGEQRRILRGFAGSCRYVLNKALALQKENREAGNRFNVYMEMAKLLTGWRNGVDTSWLKDAPCHPLQQALKDLERAYKNLFAKRADFPRFKRKRSGDSFRDPDPKQIRPDQVNKQLFLGNWKKGKAHVRQIHTCIANGRRDFLYKTTTTIRKNNAIVCIEDPAVRNTSKSAAGSIDLPGPNVKAKSGLNKSIFDQGWFEFRRQQG